MGDVKRYMPSTNYCMVQIGGVRTRAIPNAQFVRATDHDRIVAEKDAEIARLREAIDSIRMTAELMLSYGDDGVAEIRQLARAALEAHDDE
jgi:hypothetical protein